METRKLNKAQFLRLVSDKLDKPAAPPPPPQEEPRRVEEENQAAKAPEAEAEAQAPRKKVENNLRRKKAEKSFEEMLEESAKNQMKAMLQERSQAEGSSKTQYSLAQLEEELRQARMEGARGGHLEKLMKEIEVRRKQLEAEQGSEQLSNRFRDKLRGIMIPIRHPVEARAFKSFDDLMTQDPQVTAMSMDELLHRIMAPQDRVRTEAVWMMARENDTEKEFLQELGKQLQSEARRLPHLLK